MAFRKLTGMTRTYTASEQVFNALLAGKGTFHVRHPGDGHHVEARLNNQVLALIDGKNVVAIYQTSSGKPSTPTVQGKFAVYSKTPGTNAKGMVDSNYFIRGYAIHGYYSSPALQRQPRLPAGPDPGRRDDLQLAAGRRRRLGRAVVTRLGGELGEHLVQPAGRVGGAHPVRAAALAQDPLDLLERVLAVELGRVRARDLQRVGGHRADRGERAAPPDRRVQPVAGGAEG